MEKRQKYIAGNWKMNKNLEEVQSFFEDLDDFLSDYRTKSKVLIAPSFPFLAKAKEIIGNNALVSSQDVAAWEEGAYTGEVSANMLGSIGIDAAIIGHSERREYFGESAEVLKNKIEIALNESLEVIYCVGEKLEVRGSNEHFELIKKQLVESVLHLSQEKIKSVVIAYEPVWAIGTGVVASPEQAQEMHAFIREVFREKHDEETASELMILYGGSMKPCNAQELLSQTDVDGGLIGGASLKMEDFKQIIKIADEIS